jgi:hypothetical protein
MIERRLQPETDKEMAESLSIASWAVRHGANSQSFRHSRRLGLLRLGELKAFNALPEEGDIDCLKRIDELRDQS